MKKLISLLQMLMKKQESRCRKNIMRACRMTS